MSSSILCQLKKLFKVDNIKWGLLGWLDSVNCLFCQQTLSKDYICLACRVDLPWLGPACPYCSLPSHGGICGKCLRSPPAFARVCAVFQYQWPLSTAILRFKQQKHRYWRHFFAECLLESFLSSDELQVCDAVLPMPLHKRRLAERGFNQSALIANKLPLPSLESHVKRVKATPPQQSLNKKERLNNIKQSFLVKKKIKAKSILIIDDVMTTGATVQELSDCLLSQGVERVFILVLARA